MKRPNARILAPATALVNNKGESIAFLTGATVATLAHLGVDHISLDPEGTPLPDGWWRLVDMTDNAKKKVKP